MELFHQLEFRMIFDFSIKTVLLGWNNFGRNELCFFQKCGIQYACLADRFPARSGTPRNIGLKAGL